MSASRTLSLGPMGGFISGANHPGQGVECRRQGAWVARVGKKGAGGTGFPRFGGGTEPLKLPVQVETEALAVLVRGDGLNQIEPRHEVDVFGDRVAKADFVALEIAGVRLRPGTEAHPVILCVRRVDREGL